MVDVLADGYDVNYGARSIKHEVTWVFVCAVLIEQGYLATHFIIIILYVIFVKKKGKECYTHTNTHTCKGRTTGGEQIGTGS